MAEHWLITKMELTSVEIEQNLKEYIEGKPGKDGIAHDSRYASFDYCFNYFQKFYEDGKASEIGSPENMPNSCLHLGFYLASWGMYRGSSKLLQKSLKHLAKAIHFISEAPLELWEIDAHCYTKKNIELLMQAKKSLAGCYGGMTETLVTKIMLGVFGGTPAFDKNFIEAFGSRTLTPKSLGLISNFYERNGEIIEKFRVKTLDVFKDEHTNRVYTRAKVIDMIFFVEGDRVISKEKEKNAAKRI